MADHIAQVFLSADLQTLRGSAAILRVAGEIDISSVHVLREQLEIAAERGCSELIIDLTDVTFMDSTGLHALIEGKRLIHQYGSTIVLVPSPQVRSILEMMFPEPLFAARVNTVEEALGYLGLDGT